MHEDIIFYSGSLVSSTNNRNYFYFEFIGNILKRSFLNVPGRCDELINDREERARPSIAAVLFHINQSINKNKKKSPGGGGSDSSLKGGGRNPRKMMPGK